MRPDSEYRYISFSPPLRTGFQDSLQNDSVALLIQGSAGDPVRLAEKTVSYQRKSMPIFRAANKVCPEAEYEPLPRSGESHEYARLRETRGRGGAFNKVNAIETGIKWSFVGSWFSGASLSESSDIYISLLPPAISVFHQHPHQSSSKASFSQTFSTRSPSKHLFELEP